jgi:hypothetical protein
MGTGPQLISAYGEIIPFMSVQSRSIVKVLVVWMDGNNGWAISNGEPRTLITTRIGSVVFLRRFLGAG